MMLHCFIYVYVRYISITRNAECFYRDGSTINTFHFDGDQVIASRKYFTFGISLSTSKKTIRMEFYLMVLYWKRILESGTCTSHKHNKITSKIHSKYIQLTNHKKDSIFAFRFNLAHQTMKNVVRQRQKTCKTNNHKLNEIYEKVINWNMKKWLSTDRNESKR